MPAPKHATVLTCPPGTRAPRPLPREIHLYRGQTARSVIDRLAAVNLLPVRALLEQVTTQEAGTSWIPEAIALTPPALARLAVLARVSPTDLAATLDPDTIAPQDAPHGDRLLLTQPWQPGLTECSWCIHDHEHAQRGPSTWAAALCCLRHRRWCLDSQQQFSGTHAALWPAFSAAQHQLISYRNIQQKSGVTDQVLAEIYTCATDTITTWLTTHCPYSVRQCFEELHQDHHTLVADRAHLLFPYAVALTRLITPFFLNPRAELLKQSAATSFTRLTELGYTLPNHPFIPVDHWRHLYRQLRRNASILTDAPPL